MENRNMLFGIIGLLVLVVIGLGIDRSNQFSTLSEQIAVAETAVADAEAQNETLSTDLQTQTDLVTQGEETIAALSTQIAVSSTDFESQISELSDASTILADNNEGFATEVADLLSQVDDLSEQRDGLQTDLDTALADVDTLQTSYATAEAQAILSQAQADDMASIAATLEAENLILAEEVEALMPTSTPEPEPTAEVDTSEPDSTDIEFVFAVEVDNRAIAQISPDNESIAILRDDNSIEIISAVDGVQQLTVDGFDGDLSEFIYAADGRSMAAISDNNTIIVFTTNTGTTSYEQEYDNPIKGFDLSADSNALAVGTANRLEIKVFDGIEQSRPDGVTSLDWSADGSHIVISNGRSVSILDIEDYSISGTTDLDTDSAQVIDALFSPDGSHIIGVTVNSELVVWSVESGDLVWQTSVDASTINDVAWSSDSAYVAVVAEADISIYGVDGAWVSQATIDGVTSVDWSSNGEFLVFASAEQVSVVDASTLID